MNTIPAILTRDGISIERLEYVTVEQLIERKQQGLDWFLTFSATIWDAANSQYRVYTEDRGKLLGVVTVAYPNGAFSYTSSVSGETYSDRFGMIRAIYDCYQ